MSSRLTYNLFSKELWAQFWQSLLEVSIIVDVVLLFFFFISTWLIISVCSIKTQSATRTVVHGVLWAISQMPPDVSPLHSMAVAEPPACGEGSPDSAVSSHPSFYLLWLFTSCSGAECELWSSTCPSLAMSVCSLSSVIHTRHRGRPISAHVSCSRTRGLEHYCR